MLVYFDGCIPFVDILYGYILEIEGPVKTPSFIF
jgi:hypothetical protein